MTKHNKDLSIEYAHIYTNDKISEEHELSLHILGDLKEETEKNDQSYSLVVMVDDYSFPDPSFDYESYAQWLAERGFKPDIVFRESQLIPVCDELIGHIYTEKLKLELGNYVRTKKYPCSLFIAAWYLVRLGHLKTRLFDAHFVANRLINILPVSFKPFEDKAQEIIKATEFAEAATKIEYKFIAGRPLA